MAEVTNTTAAYTKFEETVKKQSKGDSLGKEDFLKLLVAQLTKQDPTNPMKDTEFVSQLATYSGLEQQMNMNKNLEKLIASNNATTTAAAVSMIGTVVGYTDENGTLKTGQVSFIDMVGGEVHLYMENKDYIPFSKVQQIGLPIKQPVTPPTTETDTTDTTTEAETETETTENP